MGIKLFCVRECVIFSRLRENTFYWYPWFMENSVGLHMELIKSNQGTQYYTVTITAIADNTES